MSDLQRREVGWLITQDNGDGDRVGWGQLRVHADETEASFDRVIARTIFMDKSLTEHMIPEEERVRWRSFDDDGDGPYYDGIVRVSWLFDEESLAYNIDRFNMEDVGATRVVYSVKDILYCAYRFDQPAWERLAKRHTPIELSGESWIMIYG
jgi:hypothetical protein